MCPCCCTYFPLVLRNAESCSIGHTWPIHLPISLASCVESLSLHSPTNNTVMRKLCSCFSFMCDFHWDWYSGGWVAESQGSSDWIFLSTTSLLSRITNPAHIPASSIWGVPLSAFSPTLILTNFLIFAIWWGCSHISLRWCFNNWKEHCFLLFSVPASLSMQGSLYFLPIVLLDFLPTSHWSASILCIFQISSYGWVLYVCLTVGISRQWFIQDGVGRLELAPKYPLHTFLHARGIAPFTQDCHCLSPTHSLGSGALRDRGDHCF